MQGIARYFKQKKFSYAHNMAYGSSKKRGRSAGAASSGRSTKRTARSNQRASSATSKRPGSKAKAFKRKSGTKGKRKGGRGGKRRKYQYPKWFKYQLKDQVPSRLVSEKASSLNNPVRTINAQDYKVGSCDWHTFHKCRTLKDIENSMKIQPLASASDDVVRANQLKSWMYEYKRTHTWRNNTGGTPCNLQFWTLVPRRDCLAFVGQAEIFPPASDNGDIAFLTDPSMLSQGFDEVDPTAIAGEPTPLPYNLPYFHVDATPYMSTKLTRMFKIVPLKLKWPDGKRSSTGVLDPGQEVKFVASAKKPLSLSFDKWGLSNSGEYRLSDMYTGLKKTPLILVKKWGVVAHSKANPDLVNFGFARVDYVAKAHWCVLANWQKDPKYLTFDKSSTGAFQMPIGNLIDDPETGIEVVGQDVDEEEKAMDVDKEERELSSGATPAPKPRPTLEQRMAAVLKAVTEDDSGDDCDVE